MPLDKKIQAELECRNVNFLPEDFQSERQVMLRDARTNKLHEPRPAL